MRLKKNIYRCPIRRMAFIAQLLREGKQFNASTVASQLETHRKTISRDIEFMRDSLGYTLEFKQFGAGEGGTFTGHPPAERIL